MDQQEFNKVMYNRIEKVKAIMASKSQEYARGDKLSNFKKAAAALGTTPEQALIGFWIKHVVSITDLCNDLETGKIAPMKMWDEKITDLINYMILLEALVVERLPEQQ
jgi:hypothetical protein